ncbi:MAG: hypothetical protein AAF383_19515 [Cyanobacteria bacterium P01_A01_bin.83]
MLFLSAIALPQPQRYNIVNTLILKAMQASSKTYYSPQEYLERETKAEFRSEYIDWLCR